jgi:Protein of unknown function (DUF4238)
VGHHYLPQEYLKAFQTSANVGEIWLYDKGSRRPYAAHPESRSVCQGYDDDVEQRLAEIEGRTNTVLKQD